MTVKKHMSLLGVLFSFGIFAQGIPDVLNLTADNLEGTARFESMSGAFGALGGDLSAMSINPAGSSIFTYSELGVSMSSSNRSNKSQYFGTQNNIDLNHLAINQLGGVFVLNNQGNSDWKKIVFGFGYHNHPYKNNFIISGANTSKGGNIGSYFLDYAAGINPDALNLQPNEGVLQAYRAIGGDRNLGYAGQQAFLGYQTYIIDYDSNSNQYLSNIFADQGASHRMEHHTTGYDRKFNFNLSAQYRDFLRIGFNLNTHTVLREDINLFYENGYENNSPVKDVNFKNWRTTTGEGISFQLGLISKLTDGLRLGLSYQSPTWYTLQDEVEQYLATRSEDTNGKKYEDIIDTWDDSYVNLLPEYDIKTPAVLTTSIAYIFGKSGLISFDYISKDFTTTRLGPEQSFSNINQEMNNYFKSATGYRIGGEYLIGQSSIRAGYRKEQGPFSENLWGDRTGYSFGFGQNFGSTVFNISYSKSTQSTTHQLFDLGLNDLANIDVSDAKVVASLTFKL